MGREVNDHTLSIPFLQYPSFIKARVIKNRQTSMSRGCYGFVSFGNSVDYLRAVKELNGNTIGIKNNIKSYQQATGNKYVVDTYLMN